MDVDRPTNPVNLTLKQTTRSGSARVKPTPKSGNGFWKDRLLQRPYRFPASGESEQDLSVKISHGDAGCYFPLGTAEVEKAAARAQLIYHVAANQGWEATCRQFSRELIVCFEWCLNPVLWTYTTIHTLVGEQPRLAAGSWPARRQRQRILVVEPDAGIRDALCWCIDQQEGFASLPCNSVDSYRRLCALHRPRLVLRNRQLAGRIDLESAGVTDPAQPGILALSYSAYADGDQMFALTPSGAGGYLIKRVKPCRFLEPIIKADNRFELITQDYLLRVKYAFRELLEFPPGDDHAVLAELTQRERETLEFMSKGFVDKEIAQAMGISPGTVHCHIKRIFQRLEVRSRTEAVIRFLEK